MREDGGVLELYGVLGAGRVDVLVFVGGDGALHVVPRDGVRGVVVSGLVLFVKEFVMRELGLPRIVSYEPQIFVSGADGVPVTLRVSVPDFASDEEVLRSFAAALGVDTVGEVVSALLERRRCDAGHLLEVLPGHGVSSRCWAAGERLG